MRWMVVALVGLVACGGGGEIEALKRQVADLQLRVEDIEEGGMLTAGEAAEVDELAGQIKRLAGELNYVDAKANWDELKERFPRSRMVRRTLGRLGAELDVVGIDVKELPPPSDKWFVGGPEALDISEGSTMVVFFEEWCPHCKREVPELQAAQQRLGDRLDVVAFTRGSRSSTDDKIQAFIEANGLTFPIAKDSAGTASTLFGVSTIPAAALVRDGTVVWRGNPASIEADQLASLVGATGVAPAE